MRLFIAIELSGSVRSRLKNLQARLGRRIDGVRWVPPANMHVTVKFLGEVPDGEVMEVTQAVARAAARVKPFTMVVDGCGCFPKRGPVRIVWAGLTERSGALLGCADAMENELEEIGYPRERRPFSAHVTIGRARSDRSDSAVRSAVEAASFESVEQAVSSVTLMSSTLTPKGPTYVPASVAKLGGIGCP